MVILLTGGTGFIGRRLLDVLARRSHTVIVAGRRPMEGHAYVRADFTRDCDVDAWLARLRNVDVVINTVGIFREHGEQTFARVHAETPKALFEACQRARVRRVVQLSALGAETGTSGYFRSKHAADEALAATSLQWTIVQPSVVYGPEGTSARLFSTLASLPVIPLPGTGTQQLQPIHIDDLVEALVVLCESEMLAGCRVPVVGPRPLTLQALLAAIRTGLGLGRAPTISIPMVFVRIAVSVASLSSRSLLDRESLAMLEAGNTADAALTARLLRREPRDPSTFIPSSWSQQARREAQLNWLLPLLRLSLASVWLWTAVVSLGLYPRQASYLLLARSGVTASLQPLFLYGAIALDLALGLATLVVRGRPALWIAQIFLILLYTAIISIRLPEFWLHPYGPLSKNLPMLAALYMLYVFEKRRWNTSS